MNMTLDCEGIISKTELLKDLKSMKNYKSPGSDGITKEFWEFFWDEIKNLLSDSIKKYFISHKQAVIKLIEKKDTDKRLIKNWRPISLLNIDTKLISKLIAIRLIKILNNLISDIDLREFPLKIVPKYYQEIIYRWNKYLSSPPSLPSNCIFK